MSDTIPVRNDIFHYSQQVELEGELYTLTFSYNGRTDSWCLDVGEERDVLQGVRLTGGIDVLKQHHHLDVPPGELVCVDLDGLGREPTRLLFGDRVVLQYTEA